MINCQPRPPAMFGAPIGHYSPSLRPANCTVSALGVFQRPPVLTICSDSAVFSLRADTEWSSLSRCRTEWPCRNRRSTTVADAADQLPPLDSDIMVLPTWVLGKYHSADNIMLLLPAVASGRGSLACRAAPWGRHTAGPPLLPGPRQPAIPAAAAIWIWCDIIVFPFTVPTRYH